MNMDQMTVSDNIPSPVVALVQNHETYIFFFFFFFLILSFRMLELSTEYYVNTYSVKSDFKVCNIVS